MLRLKPQFKRATCLTISMFLSFSSVSTVTLAASTNERKTNPGFTFTNPTVGNGPAGGEKINLGDLVIGAEDGTSNSGSTTTPTPGDGTDIGINLPNLPGRVTNIGGIAGGGIPGFPGSSNIPSNNPYAPWTPYDSYGDGTPGMLAIPQSMVPGVICPLVDNRPNPELLQAIDQLFQYVIPTGPCHSARDQGKINELANTMKTAGTALKTLNSGIDDGSIDANSVNLSEVQGNIKSIVEGMGTLGTIVTSSPMSGNSVCGQANLKGSELLTAMGNLVTSVAPYALLLASVGTGGTATPAALAAGTAIKPGMISLAKPALKYLLGAFAVGSVASVYGNLIESKTINMEKPDQREALLQNLCEFFRIEQRVNYLKLADMGNIRDINQRLEIAKRKLQVFKNATQAAMSKSYPKQVMALAQIEDDVTAQLSAAQKSIRADKKELQDIGKVISASPNNGVLCSFGQMLAKRAEDPKAFPGRTLKNFQFIVSKQTLVTSAQEGMINAEQVIREALKANASRATSQARQCAPGTQCMPFQECAELSKNYLANIQSIIADGDQKIGTLRSSLNNTLNEYPEYREFKGTQAAVKREVKIRENTGRLVALLAGDNGSTVREEIDNQMDLLKKTLFNTNSVFGYSPVLAWLKFSDVNYRSGVTTYQNELASLYAYAKRAATPSSRYNRNSDILKEQEMVENLSMISSKNIQPGSNNAKLICHKLTNLTLEWGTVINHLKSQKFFCDSIQSMMDERVEKRIGAFCFGDANPINGVVYKPSEIEENLLALGKKYGARARLIDSKYKDLQCEQKDATEVMN